jgi:D-glycero-alpha-D-manno-heptose-7-phosphate kinase
MIITRSPLRITLGGGGTDLPSYYTKFGGMAISAAIDKYCYVAIQKAFGTENIIRYSKTERVLDLGDIQHPLIRECCKLVIPSDEGIEIVSMADVPAGTGLGSSGAFTCALLKALHVYNGDHISANELAEEACKVEIDILKNPVGKQDQYASAYGGINTFNFFRNGSVYVDRMSLGKKFLYALEDDLHLFFTGFSRSASEILSEQVGETIAGNEEIIENLLDTRSLGSEMKDALYQQDLDNVSNILNKQWALKGKRVPYPMDIAVTRIDMLKCGASGVKLVGAGGGGFLMAYWPRCQYNGELPELRFRFDHFGTTVMTS